MGKYFEKYGKAMFGLCLGLATFSAISVLDIGISSGKSSVPESDISKLQQISAEKIIASDPFATFEKVKFPVMPIPKLPASPDKIGPVTKSTGARVVGIIKDRALISKGSKTYMVMTGENSEVGFIGDVSDKGVYIDGLFFPLANSSKKNETNER